MNKRLLLVKMSSLGDVVHALPAVADAVAHGWQIDWLVEEAFADIPPLVPGVTRVIPIAWRRWRKNLSAAGSEMRSFYRQLRQNQYDLVLDSQGLIKSAVVAMLAPAPVAGYSHTTAREPWSAFTYRYRHPVARGQHAVDRQRQLFAAALGYVVPAGEPAALFADEVQAGTQPWLFFLHGTTWDSKHWPPDMWLELARLAVQHGYQVAVTAGNEVEKKRAELISTVAGVQRLEKMPLADLVGRLRQASLVVGVDSGLTHLSAALGRPTLGLYGATSAQLTGCRGARAIALQATTPCAPCVGAQCKKYVGDPQFWRNEIVQPPCYATLPPEYVWQRCLEMLPEALPGTDAG